MTRFFKSPRWLLPTPAALVLLVLTSGSVSSQAYADLAGGMAIGSHTATAAGLDFAPELSYEAGLSVRLTPRIGLFAGYAHTAFGCVNGYCQQVEPVISANHGQLGVEYSFGRAFLRVGGVYGSSKGTPTFQGIPPGETTDPGVGILVGWGLALGGERFSVRPMLSYVRFPADDAAAGSGSATGISGKLGFRIGIPGLSFGSGGGQ